MLDTVRPQPPMKVNNSAYQMSLNALEAMDTPRSTAEEIGNIVREQGIQSFYTEAARRGVKRTDLAMQMAIGSKMPLFPSIKSMGKGDSPEEPTSFPRIQAGNERWVICERDWLYVLNPWDGDSYTDAYSSHKNIKGTGVISYPLMMQLIDEASSEDSADPSSGPQPAVGGIDVVDEASDKWINGIIMQAARMKASDIHLVPGVNEIQVRVRIDGETRPLTAIPFGPGSHQTKRYEAISNRIISRSKASQKLGYFREEVGGIFLFDELQGRQIKVRVAGIPSDLPNQREPFHKYTMRLLGNALDSMTLEDLGVPNTEDNSQLQDLLLLSESKHGLMLVTGPTGAGKTTTLYALLQQLRSYDSSKMMYTLEDPPEINLNGVVHSAVTEQLSWADGFKNILRQDPDVILIGEIRELAVAKKAIEASQTGHLVMSTLHTNSAISSVSRLRDIGVESYNISDVLLGITAQRLAKVDCPHCARQARWGDLLSGNHEHLRGVDKMQLRMHYHSISKNYPDLRWGIGNEDTVLIPKPGGCQACKGMGYSGRVAISELLKIAPELRSMILQNATQTEIHSVARERYNFLEMWEHAMQLIKAQKISFDHAIAALGPRQSVIDEISL